MAMNALEEAIKKQRELYEDRGGAIHHEILATLVGAKEEVDRLEKSLGEAIVCIEEFMDTPGTEFNFRDDCKAVASWVDDWRAALAPFQPGRGAVKP